MPAPATQPPHSSALLSPLPLSLCPPPTQTHHNRNRVRRAPTTALPALAVPLAATSLTSTTRPACMPASTSAAQTLRSCQHSGSTRWVFGSTAGKGNIPINRDTQLRSCYFLGRVNRGESCLYAGIHVDATVPLRPCQHSGEYQVGGPGGSKRKVVVWKGRGLW